MRNLSEYPNRAPPVSENKPTRLPLHHPARREEMKTANKQFIEQTDNQPRNEAL